MIKTPKEKQLFEELVQNDLIGAKALSEVKPGIELVKDCYRKEKEKYKIY